MINIISNIIISMGIVFVTLGIIGIYRFESFYKRALVSSIVDTTGYLTLMFGIILKEGLSFFSLKVSFIVLITLIVNPLISHAITRSAYISGYKLRKD
ncbi:cation:proton antiporter [Proteocatella sphenisci]|uniref:cation:proton antiporter n=1 Tax=Proteocatella sphenisci TaxID=181070 RepID=UPI0004B98214|nr:monovalent cation/H(+) antiporter subunit G [Proteocatella sphenisci]